MKKTLAILAASCLLIDLTQAQTTATTTTGRPSSVVGYRIGEQGADSRVWQKIVRTVNAQGRTVLQTNQAYVELATGLNYWKNGQWVESKEEIDILPNGTAAATQGRHQAYFPGDIYQGEIRLVTPDGKTLQSRPLGLSYDDGVKSVLIAELKDSVGQLVGSNQVIYPDAFTGVEADLRYTYTKAGFEQDIILREQPPTPESYGLNPATARLQVLTEFFNPPQPAVTTMVLPKQAGITLSDENLDFGTMKMMPGWAFLLRSDTHEGGASVSKSWVKLEGRQFLVEEVPVTSIAGELNALPQPAVQTSSRTIPQTISKTLVLPPQRLAKATTNTMFLTKASSPSRGLVLDYVTMTTQTGWTFQGDTTYYISGAVNLYGTNTFEGGAVLKYASNASLAITISAFRPTINWQASAYRPVIFTAVDDNSVGESFGSGNPSGYYANPVLQIIESGTIQTISYFRIAYARQAVSLSCNNSCYFYNGQIVNCQNGFTAFANAVYLRNVLFSSVQTNFNNLFSCSLDVQNSTFSSSSYLTAVNEGYQSFNPCFTNCLFVNVSNLTNNPTVPWLTYQISGSDNGFYNSPNFGSSTVTNNFYPFQAVGAGNYYLTNGCAFTNAGTTNIDLTLLADLKKKTTHPPIVSGYSNVTITSNVTLGPQAPRDTNAAPDLGYHYDPIDYITERYFITNATLTINNGTVIACYNDLAGIWLQDGSSVVSVGTPLTPNRFVWYLAVQEQPISIGPDSLWDSWNINSYHYGSVGPNGTFQFSQFVTPAGGEYQFYNSSGWAFNSLLVQNCELWNGQNIFDGADSTTANIQNTLFARSSISAGSVNEINYSLSFSNSLFWNTPVTLQSYSNSNIWFLFNNDFDSCTISEPGRRGVKLMTINGYNAYLNCSGQLYPTNANDIVLTNSLAYQSGPLGGFYQPTNSPLIHAGSTTADQVGLYHYTVMTNQVIESTNTVSIGYHYIAVDQYGNPLDSNSNGIPDYIEDANGNGLVDNGETNWALAILTQPQSQAVIQGSNATFSVTAAGITPLSYQWYFNGMNVLGGATNTSLTLTNVQTTNAGNYAVVVTNAFGSATSSNAVLTVPIPPTVSITNPADNTIIIASQTNVTLTATASDFAGTIIQVQFFEGATNSLGIVTNPPYSLVWSNAQAGSYGLTAVADDNYGLSATSSVVNITISSLFASNNVRLWLKANVITGLTNNAPVSTWPDSSGWNNSATQSYTYSQPLYVTNALNGLPVVRFNPTNNNPYPSDQYFTLPNFLNGTTQAEAFVVLKANVAPGQGNGPLWTLGTGGMWDSELGYPNGSGNIVDDFGSTSYCTVGIPAQPLYQYHLYEVAGQSNYWAAWINGELQYSTTTNIYGYNPYPTLGEGFFGNPCFAGDIAEVLVFDRTLTAGERLAVNEYLDAKYAVVTAPTPPTNLTATAISSTQIGLTWQETWNGGAGVAISLERATNSEGVFTVVAEVSGVTSYVDTNLAAGTTYYYRAKASNWVGESGYSAETNATTLMPPMIITEPTNQIVFQGSNATFTVTAIGTMSLSYQWYFNSAALESATNATLTLNNIQTTDAGNYYVVITNAVGSVTSSNATLTIPTALSGSLTNYMFEFNMTYYIGTPVQLYGVTTIEGGAVIKYAGQPAAQMTLNGPLVCLTGPSDMAVLTSKDDNSAGVTIEGSTGNPSNTNSGTYLSDESGQTNDYRFLRLAYAGTGISGSGTVSVRDSQFVQCRAAIDNSAGGTVTLMNNLFYYSAIANFVTNLQSTLALSNNLVFGTTVNLPQPSNTVWYAFNNDFDTCTITNSTLTNGYNAYLNCNGRLYPTNANDVVTNATLAYQTSWLGGFYQPPDSPLIHAGSTTADQVGLYHYTVTTNQVIEGTNTVSIGYHYVAVDAYGNPLDYDGDGIPDYLEDSNGDGVYNTGDLSDWQAYDSANGLTAGNGLMVFTPLK